MATASLGTLDHNLSAPTVDDSTCLMTVSNTRVSLLPGDLREVLAQAIGKLRRHDDDAWEFFAAIAQKHDVREAWLGLAVAHHFRNEPKLAVHAMAHAFSCHAITDIPRLADMIAASLDMPGWCALNGGGILTVHVAEAITGAQPPTATLDGKPLRLRAGARRGAFTGRLSGKWQCGGEIRVSAGDLELIGSPIALRTIVRVEGFVDSRDGDLYGWIRCPNDPDHDPLVSVVPADGGPGITVVATEQATQVMSGWPFARPRRFHIPAEKLRFANGPVRVCGRDGRNLTGSPLDPFEERRSAEAAARIIAGLFPAPGNPPRPSSSGRLQSAPARVVGIPVTIASRKRSVDIVVPVYGGLDHTLACLESVLVDLPRWARVVVVDDASPDPQVGKRLNELAACHQVTLLTQVMNRGFPTTANVGMRHDALRDVVLLNSDTLLPPGWLALLRDAAYSAPDIGSATPLSNDATILSYPSIEHTNKVPDLNETIELNALAQKANAGKLVDIPTAIGFCVYIKRDCLNAVGLLREDVFAQGYGEENDFCIRARHLGWRHVAVPNVFVTHIGGQSFGPAKQHLIERNIRMLNLLHPGYDVLIRDFQRTDPMADVRRCLDLERWKTYRSSKKSVLLVTHGRGGGVQRHVAERTALLRAQGLRPIVLWPVASRDGESRDCVLGNGHEGGTPNLRFAIPAELDLLTRILRADNPVRAEVHHLIGHDHQVLDLFRRLAIPYEMIIHDYSLLCPRINLVGSARRYCGEPDVKGCEACVADAGSRNDENIAPGALRERSAVELAGASGIVVPSKDVGTRVKRYFPATTLTIRCWEDDSALTPPEPLPVTVPAIRRVCIIGAIGIEKGYDILLECARDAADRNLDIRFHLVGHSCDDKRLLETGVVHITGRYQEHEAVGLIRQQHAQLAWLTSIWPEAWCYTLTQAWQAGLSVFAFDIGTQSERIRQTGWGRLCPLGTPPQAINRLLMEKTVDLEAAA